MTEPVYRRAVPVMGTIVTIDVVGYSVPPTNEAAQPVQEAAQHLSPVEEAVERAFDWFRQIEECCSRFDPHNELSQLSATVGVAVPVSATLYQAVQFALAVAAETAGAFDPTVGAAMETRGFNRDYRTGQPVRNAPVRSPRGVSYRHVCLDPERKTVTLLRPLLLDLGAVAKGMAIDMAAHELRPFANFAINAGGDVYVSGHNSHGAPWSVGIRHPRIPGALIDVLCVSDRAVCTSGDYERCCSDPASGVATSADAPASSAAERGEHHIFDPRIGRSPQAAASATVVAPTAMLADALATAALVLGPPAGLSLLERLGVDGLIFSPALDRHATRVWAARRGGQSASRGRLWAAHAARVKE